MSSISKKGSSKLSWSVHEFNGHPIRIIKKDRLFSASDIMKIDLTKKLEDYLQLKETKLLINELECLHIKIDCNKKVIETINSEIWVDVDLSLELVD